MIEREKRGSPRRCSCQSHGVSSLISGSGRALKRQEQAEQVVFVLRRCASPPRPRAPAIQEEQKEEKHKMKKKEEKKEKEKRESKVYEANRC